MVTGFVGLAEEEVAFAVLKCDTALGSGFRCGEGGFVLELSFKRHAFNFDGDRFAAAGGVRASAEDVANENNICCRKVLVQWLLFAAAGQRDVGIEQRAYEQRANNSDGVPSYHDGRSVIGAVRVVFVAELEVTGCRETSGWVCGSCHCSQIVCGTQTERSTFV